MRPQERIRYRNELLSIGMKDNNPHLLLDSLHYFIAAGEHKKVMEIVKKIELIPPIGKTATKIREGLKGLLKNPVAASLAYKQLLQHRYIKTALGSLGQTGEMAPEQELDHQQFLSDLRVLDEEAHAELRELAKNPENRIMFNTLARERYPGVNLEKFWEFFREDKQPSKKDLVDREAVYAASKLEPVNEQMVFTEQMTERKRGVLAKYLYRALVNNGCSEEDAKALSAILLNQLPYDRVSKGASTAHLLRALDHIRK